MAIHVRHRSLLQGRFTASKRWEGRGVGVKKTWLTERGPAWQINRAEVDAEGQLKVARFWFCGIRGHGPWMVQNRCRQSPVGPRGLPSALVT